MRLNSLAVLYTNLEYSLLLGEFLGKWRRKRGSAAWNLLTGTAVLGILGHTICTADFYLEMLEAKSREPSVLMEPFVKLSVRATFAAVSELLLYILTCSDLSAAHIIIRKHVSALKPARKLETFFFVPLTE